MSTSWNEAEDDALQGLPLEAQVLYLRGLRKHMDYRTGVVGVTRGISYQMLREVLFVEPVPGDKRSGSPSKSAVRRLVGRLVDAGLAVPMSEGKRLIFRLPLATQDQCARNKADTRPTQGRHTQADTPPGSVIRNTTSPPYSPPPSRKRAATALRIDAIEAVQRGVVSHQVVEAFIEHREALRKPLTQRALEINIRNAAGAMDIGMTPDEAIEQTIAAGWQGVNLEWLRNRAQAVSGRRKTFDEYRKAGRRPVLTEVKRLPSS